MKELLVSGANSSMALEDLGGILMLGSSNRDHNAK